MESITKLAIEELRKLAAKHKQASVDLENANGSIRIILEPLDNDSLLNFSKEYPEFDPWVSSLLFDRKWVPEETVNSCLDECATAELWAKSEVRYRVDIIWTDFPEYGKTTFHLFHLCETMTNDEIQSLVALKPGKTIEDFRHDYAWTAVEDTFSKEEVQLLHNHFSTFGNLKLKAHKANAPGNNWIGYGGQAVGGVDDFYAFYKAEGYDLPFQVEGYFRRDENEIDNPVNKLLDGIDSLNSFTSGHDDSDITPDDIPF